MRDDSHSTEAGENAADCDGALFEDSERNRRPSEHGGLIRGNFPLNRGRTSLYVSLAE
jgi:hypothetical protein